VPVAGLGVPARAGTGPVSAPRGRGLEAIAAERIESVQRPRYSAEHMFVSVQRAEPTQQGANPWT
jgi:hypothetical protein